MPNTRTNPYVGPRSFRTGETLYGRERETLELLDLVIAERIVLLYSPSGAGKTSLIQAALLPKLREEGFRTVPPIRVSAEPPPMAQMPEQKGVSLNRFVLSALLSLEEQQAQEKRLPLTALAKLTVDEYLNQRTDLAEVSPVFIFDQFEEVLTLDPMNLDAKFAFFEQIGEALRNRSRWVLFSMREDYLAGLDPYLKPIPTRFATTYRLDLLGINAAREAIQKPARKGEVDFTDAAANKLVNDLRQVQVQRPDGSMELQPGPYVEPVQLQVVCFRLWDKLPVTKNTIVESDIADVGDVSTALADYYDTSVKNVAAALRVSERAIRDWFDRQLITEQGIRGQVLMEREASRGLLNQAIRLLEDAHLVRADERRGATWFELAHDRLIEPIRASNKAWFQVNLSPLQQAADLWMRQGRADDLLLRGKALSDAEVWAQKHANELTPTEQEFLAECRQARLATEKEQRQNQRIRFLAIGASILSLLALVAFVIAVLQFGAANAAADAARSAQATAVANEQDAQRQRQEVITQDRVSKMVSGAQSQLEADPEVSLLLATEAYSMTQDAQTDDALRQAVIASRLRKTLGGHGARVLNVDISPDDTRVATGDGNGTARVWDLNSGELLATLPNHQGTVWSVTFSPDGMTLVTTDDGRTRFWDVGCLNATSDNANCLTRELGGHTNLVYTGAFSPDGTQLVTASADQTAIVWDAATGAPEQVLRGHSSEVNSAAFSPDGTKVVTASADQTLRVWDLANCNPDCAFVELTGPAGALWTAAFSPDGKYIIAASDDQNAYKFDVESGNVITLLVGHTDSVYGAAFSPDGELIVTVSADGTARLWDANFGTVLAVLRGHNGNVNNVAFNSDGEIIATASEDGTAKIWNEGSGPELKTVRGHTNKVFSVAFSPDGKRVITASQDSSAGVWDTATGLEALPALVGHAGWVLDATFSPDGTRAVTTSDDGTARVWDLTACDGTECPSTEIKIGEGVILYHASFSPDGTRLLLAASDGKLRLFDAATLNELPFTNAEGAELRSAVYSRDGRRIATASIDGAARVLDAATGQVLLTLTGQGGALTSIAFSPDGAWIVTGSEDRTARIRDAATGQEKFVLRGHNGAVNAVAVSPDGKLILTASSDKTARLWDAATGEQLSVLRGHTDGLTGAAFSPDGKFVATSSSDRTVRITLTAIGDIFALAQTRATRQLTCDEWRIYLQESDYCPTGASAPIGSAAPTLIAMPPPTPGALLPPTPDIGAQVDASPTPQPSPTVESVDATVEPTDAVPEETPTPEATETPVEQATPTNSVPPTVAATATPEAPPGVYAVSMQYAPIDPNAKPTQLMFTVNFLNTTGTDANLARWLVLIYRQGETKSFGDTRGEGRVIANGASSQQAGPYQVNLPACENFTAVPVWEDNEARRTPFTRPDGSPLVVPFQLCP